MATYRQPKVSRAYETIYADILSTALPTDPDLSGPAFWRAHAEGCERMRDLWNEIVFRAADDKAVPRWAAYAAISTRESYAREAHDARRRVEELNAR